MKINTSQPVVEETLSYQTQDVSDQCLATPDDSDCQVTWACTMPAQGATNVQILAIWHCLVKSTLKIVGTTFHEFESDMKVFKTTTETQVGVTFEQSGLTTQTAQH